MNDNLEKILSISVGVLLITIAFTVFFMSYNRHYDYIDHSIEAISEDMMVDISKEEVKPCLSGNEVIHRIIEARGHQEAIDLQDFYGVDAEVYIENVPEVWIDGKNVKLLEIDEIDSARFYHVYYETDFQGKITRINYMIVPQKAIP